MAVDDFRATISKKPPRMTASDAALTSHPEPRLVAAQYVVTFLKPEMLHIYRQVTALEKFRPVVLTQKRENSSNFPFPDVTVVPKPRTHPLRRLWQKQILRRPITIYRSEARRLAEVLKAREARVLHIYFGHIGVHLLPLLELCEQPVVVSFHGADAQVDLHRPVHLALTQQMLGKATLILARSQSLVSRIVAAGGDPAKVRLHRTGVPMEEIAFRQRAVPADGAWRCVQACRVIPKKGLLTSVRAFAKFAERWPRATFTIAGEGPQIEVVRSMARNLGIGRQVFFTGFLSQEKLRALFAEAHLFLHPSELGPDGDQEGVPNAMLEAMASGLPIIATTHGGIPEAVAHEQSGLLVPERDHAAVANAMLTLASDPARYGQMSAAAARQVRDGFELRAQARVLERCYDEALEMHAAQIGT